LILLRRIACVVQLAKRDIGVVQRFERGGKNGGGKFLVVAVHLLQGVGVQRKRDTNINRRGHDETPLISRRGCACACMLRKINEGPQGKQF